MFRPIDMRQEMNLKGIESNRDDMTIKVKLIYKTDKFRNKKPKKQKTNKCLINLIFQNMRMNFYFNSIQKQKKKRNSTDFGKVRLNKLQRYLVKKKEKSKKKEIRRQKNKKNCLER